MDSSSLSQSPGDGANALGVAEADQQLRGLRMVADGMPQIVWSTRPDGYHDYFNAAWFDYTGLSLDRSVGDQWRLHFHPDDAAAAAAEWDRCTRTGSPYEVEYRLRGASGEYRWMLGRARPLHGSDGNIMRWIGTCTDIEDMRRMRARDEAVNQELNHRIKNIFSVIGGLIRLEAREHPEADGFAASIAARIEALGRAHSISVGGRDQPESRSLNDIVTTVLAPYDTLATITLDIPGDLHVVETALLPIGLALHELATNAAKYGALASRRALTVSAARVANDEVRLIWREESPDPAAAVISTGQQTGFGSRLLRLTIEDQLRGSIVRAAEDGALVKTLHFPARIFAPAAEGA